MTDKPSYEELELKIRDLEEEASVRRALQAQKRAQEAQRRAEDALKRSEDSYRYLIENANDIIYKINLGGYFTFFNPAALRTTGRSEEALHKIQYLDLIRPDYREKTNDFYISQFTEEASNTYYEFPMIRRNGEEIWLGQNVQLSREGDRIVGFHAVARDITKQRLAEEALKKSQKYLERRVKERTLELEEINREIINEINIRKRSEEALRVSEQKYRLLAENVTDVIWTIDSEMKLTYISPSINNLLGYSSEEALGQHLNTSLTENSRGRSKKMADDIISRLEANGGEPFYLCRLI